MTDQPTVNECGFYITTDRLRLLADLLANPTETVEDDT